MRFDEENRPKYHRQSIIALICTCLLLLLSACQNTPAPRAQSSPHPTPSPTPSVGASSRLSQLPPQAPTPTSTPLPSINPNRPVLAFYYAWYSSSDWCLCHMSDLPTIQYNSSDDTTITQQLTWAAHAGI